MVIFGRRKENILSTEAAVAELAGCFVVEVGQRQAWTFIGFADNRPTPGRETRLYIDAEWHLHPSGQMGSDPFIQLLELDGLTVDAARTSTDPASLVVMFDNGARLVVAAEPAFPTSGAAWWLADWR